MAIEENLELQRRLYGESLADIARRVRASLGLTQAGLADVLGLSAPMMSQLLSGQRAKIGNPAVLGRLQALIQLSSKVSTLTATQRNTLINNIREATPTISTSVEPVLQALRSAAPQDELMRLAGLTTSPDLSQLLRNAANHG